MTQIALCSVIVITKNEEKNLARCLRHIPKGWPKIVVDSQSEDETVSLAQSLGCDVYINPFENFAAQKNFALSKVKTPWVFSLDADEEFSGFTQLEQIIKSKGHEAFGFRVTRQLHFMGKLMRFGKTKDAPLRLFLREKAHFEGAIHESIKIAGAIAHIAGPSIIHYSYENLSDYFNRFNRYTTEIAKNHRRRKKRAFLPTLVLRPWGEFISRYFLRLGFLDGFPGYCYALNSSLYAFIKYAKLYEYQNSHVKVDLDP